MERSDHQPGHCSPEALCKMDPLVEAFSPGQPHEEDQVGPRYANALEIERALDPGERSRILDAPDCLLQTGGRQVAAGTRKPGRPWSGPAGKDIGPGVTGL